MAVTNVRKNINLFVDGRGYAGQIAEFNAPKLSLKTEEFRAGGMPGPVKMTMGLQAMDTDFTLYSFDRDVLALFGIAEGATVPLVAREALESMDGQVSAAIHTMRGKVVALDPGTSKPGGVPTLKVSMNLVYYKLQFGDRVVQEIDLENMVQSVNGNDALAAVRGALGM